MKAKAKKLSGKELNTLFHTKPLPKTKEEIKTEKIQERIRNFSYFNYVWIIPVVFLTLWLNTYRIGAFQDFWNKFFNNNREEVFLSGLSYCFWLYLALIVIHYITNTPKVKKCK